MCEEVCRIVPISEALGIRAVGKIEVSYCAIAILEGISEQARLFQERTATDRPTLCLLAIAWTVVLAIIVALFVF